MDFELYPTITLRSRSFNALLAPREMFIQALNRNHNLQRFRVIYVCENYLGVLSSLDPRIEALDVRRAFTACQLMTILEERSWTVEQMPASDGSWPVCKPSAWGIVVGRRLESVRMAMKDVSAGWMKATNALKKEDQVYGQMVAEIAKKHSSDPILLPGGSPGDGGVFGAGGDDERVREEVDLKCFHKPTLISS